MAADRRGGRRGAREQLDQDYGFAAYEWEVALEQSRMAPPDPRFASRIRHIAEAAARRAATIRDCMDDPGFGWTPIPGSAEMTLSYELRPGGIRPGPKDAWDRFDRVVARLGTAMEGSSASAVAGALSDLASAMTDVADAIENRPARAGEARASERRRTAEVRSEVLYEPRGKRANARTALPCRQTWAFEEGSMTSHAGVR